MKNGNNNQTPRVVVISGGSQGIGRQMLSLFEKNGDTVICLSRSTDGSIKNHIACDVSSESGVKAAIEKITAEFGQIDILINNAGKGISGATELLPLDKVREVMDTDYYGALYLSRECLPILSKGGKIVNISSACALFPLPFRGVYCSAKAAMNMLSFGMRMELKDAGIKVVCVCPGDIRTTFTANRIKNFETNERYKDRPLAAAEKIDLKQHKRMDENTASKKIYRIASKKNGAFYIIGAKFKFLFFMQKLLPQNLFIKLTGKFFG